jgi:hypothetical protein
MKAPVVSPVTSNNNPHGETHEEKSRRVIGGVINNVVQDYCKHPKDGTIWTPTTAEMSGYDISRHWTEEDAQAPHLEENPGQGSWRVTISVLPPDYIKTECQVPQPEGSLSQAKQYLVKQASHTSASASHSETRQSEVKTRDEPAEEHEWGSDMVLAGRGPYMHPLESKVDWGNEENEIQEPPRVLSFKSDFEDGWKD